MAIRLTESALRRIIRGEARRLLEGADPELEDAEAELRRDFPSFFATRGVVLRGADGNIYAVPSGSPRHSNEPRVWDPGVGFVTQSAWEVAGGTFSPPSHPGGVRGPVRSPARAARRAGMGLRESSGPELEAARTAASQVWPGQEFSIWRSESKGGVHAAGAVSKDTAGLYYEWDPASGHWIYGMDHVKRGPVPPQAPRGVRAAGRAFRGPARGPFRSESGDSFSFEDLLSLLGDFVLDSSITEDGADVDDGVASEFVADFLENNELTGRVSRTWIRAAEAAVIRLADEAAGDRAELDEGLLRESAGTGRPVLWAAADWLVGRRLAPTGGDQGLSPDGRDVVRVPPGEPCQVVGVAEGRGHAAGARERLLLRLGDGTELVIPVIAVIGKWDFLD